MKRSLKFKILSAVMSILLTLQIVPLSSLAISNDEITISSESSITEEESLPIICEDVSKRTEYTKDFLLEDGSFYKISTIYPLHSLTNEGWIDCYNAFLNVDTINDVKQAINLLNSANSIANDSIQIANESSESISNITITPIYNADICWATEYEAYEIASPDGALRITANSIEPYINKNKVINSAYINFTRDDIDNPANIETTIYEGIAEVTSENIDGLKILDKMIVSDIDEYNIDITNLYAKWDIGVTEKHGIVVRAKGNDYLTMKNIYFEVFYEELDLKDIDYTYRTIELGNPGTFNINNYTNTVFFEQKLFKLNSNILPIYISRINNGVNPVVSNSAGYGFTWNIESTISVNGKIGTWNTIDYQKKLFVPEGNSTQENGYQVWKEIGTNGIEDKSSIYFYISNDDVVNNTVNYSNVFIIQGETKYSFDSSGKLIKVERPCAENEMLMVSIVYDDEGNLDYITDENNETYNFTYNFANDLRRSYLSKITIGNSGDYIEFTTEKETANTIKNSEFVENTANFSNGTVVILWLDKIGNLIRVKDIKENFWYFNYVNYDDREKDSGNRITSLGRLFYMEESDSYHNRWLLKFYEPNGYFRKIDRYTDLYLGEEIKTTEIIQYDRKHRIITHKDYDGKCISIEYDENGIVSSCAFNENRDNLLANSHFENAVDSDDYAWTTNEYTEITNSTWEDDEEHGYQELRMSLTEETNCIVTQNVRGDFRTNNTYVVGAWVKVNGTIPAKDRKIGVEVIANDNTSVSFASFDNGLDGEWQYRLQAFKLTNNCNELKINLAAYNQIGEIMFDEITLFEAVDSEADLLNMVTSSPISYSINADGTINSEIMTDGIYSMSQLYVYDENGNVIEIKDINGLTKYFKHDSFVKWIGTEKDSDGDIKDATQLIYDSYGILQTVSKTIYAITTGDDKNLTTIYNTVNNRINSVYHNDIEYFFNYNQDGTLNSVDVSATTNNHSLLVEYGYTGISNIGYISYSNGYEIDYTYDSKGNITLVECLSVDPNTYETTLIKSYEYTYNPLGKLVSAYDSATGYTIIYSDNGYSLETTRNNESNSIELYSKNINDNGELVETFRQKYFNETNNESFDTIVSGNVTTLADSISGNIENKSNVVINKNTSLNEYSSMTYDRSSITDYFNRLIKKSIVLTYDVENTTSGEVVSDTKYDYQSLGVGITSGLVSRYDNTIYSNIGVPNDTMLECAAYSRYFEYDHKGNIKFTFEQNGSTVTPIEYYEYDEANQLVLSIDFKKNEVATYVYNEGGNVILKTYYDFLTTEFDYENHSIIALGSIIKEKAFTYDNAFKDRLIKTTLETSTSLEENTKDENSFMISYDSMGNPLNYQGYNTDGETISGTLKWNGEFLSSFENDTLKIEYEYDINGYRTQKTVSKKAVNSNGSYSWETEYNMYYIWNNGMLTSLLYSSDHSEERNINIVYDQEGKPTGFVSAHGIPYLYIKDVNENVVGLVNTSGEMFVSITYDDWGKPEFTFNNNNPIPTDVEMMTLVLNPVTYHGYIYDYEIGMYCNQNRCYSPIWGRYLNPESPTTLLEYSEDVLDANLYLFCNNNPVNNIDPYAMWSRDYVKVGWNARGFNVAMNDLFASRSFCTVFANQFLKEYGEWDAVNGYTYWGMNSLRIASNLFAHYIGNTAPNAINKVNSIWGDGWLSNNTITIKSSDENAWKYEKIWYAAPEIKAHAWSEGIHITL